MSDLTEYGSQKLLEEILEELCLFCLMAGKQNPQITIFLPRKAIEQFTLAFKAKQGHSEGSSIPVAYNSQYGIVDIKEQT